MHTNTDRAALVAELAPTFRAVARRFSPKSRGAISLEDLQQIAAIEALKFADKFDPARAGSTTLRDHVYRNALSACEEHVRLHSADVHVSDYGARRRSRARSAVVEKPVPVLIDRDAVPDRQVDETPETLLLDASTRAAVHGAVGKLSRPRAKLVRQVYGIGCVQKTVAEIAREMQIPRKRLDDALHAALADLRLALADRV